jgi:hypothetical protein
VLLQIKKAQPARRRAMIQLRPGGIGKIERRFTFFRSVSNFVFSMARMPDKSAVIF